MAMPLRLSSKMILSLCEVGAAPGKATLPLARLGFAITCVELGAALAAEARRNVAAFPKVTVTGVTGKIAFDPQGDLIKPPYTLFEVQQGQWKSQRSLGGNGV